MSIKLERMYYIKTNAGDLPKMRQICIDFDINDNGVFEQAQPFHFAWGLSPCGLIYLSPTTFLIHQPDFNSVEELEEFLSRLLFKTNIA